MTIYLSPSSIDITILEGAGVQTLGQFCHSKHFVRTFAGGTRHSSLLLVRPFASFLWPIYTTDLTRLMPVFQRLLERFGIAQLCVADRGMISASTIAALLKAGLAYIRRARAVHQGGPQLVIEDDGVAVPLVIPRQKGETQLAIGGRR